MMRLLLLVALVVPIAAHARPVVVELFTSEACSSCPPADALLGRLKAEDKDLLPLDLHVTYWDGTGWVDPFSLPIVTARQQWYASLQHSTELYTPEAVVDGRAQVVGSDRVGLLASIARAKRDAAATAVPLSISVAGRAVAVSVGSGIGPATLWLFGFDDSHTTHIGGGENVGATLREVNVVRSVTSLGTWNGKATNFSVARPKGAHLAVLLQRDDGSILGAASD